MISRTPRMSVARTPPARVLPGRMTLAFALSFLLLAPAACEGPPPPPPGEDVLVEIPEGTPRAEVMDRLPPGELSQDDSPQQLRGYRLERYFIDGATVEVVWLHREGSGGDYEDPRADLTPVTFRDGLLDGWGWVHFDEWADPRGLTGPGEAEDS